MLFRSSLEHYSRETGKNIKRQIEIFLEEKSSSKPMIIAQGNCYETYMYWVEYVLKEIPSSYYKQPKRSNTWVEENLDTAPSKNPYLEGVLDEKTTDTSSADQKGLARPSPSEIASNPYLNDVFPGTKSDISPARSFAKSAGGSATRALISAPAMVYGGKLGYNIGRLGGPYAGIRSEEHTSELQSH